MQTNTNTNRGKADGFLKTDANKNKFVLRLPIAVLVLIPSILNVAHWQKKCYHLNISFEITFKPV